MSMLLPDWLAIVRLIELFSAPDAVLSLTDTDPTEPASVNTSAQRAATPPPLAPTNPPPEGHS